MQRSQRSHFLQKAMETSIFFWQSFSSLQSNDMSVSLQSEAVCTRHPLKRNILFCSSRFFSLYHFFSTSIHHLYLSSISATSGGIHASDFLSLFYHLQFSLSLCLKKDSLCFNWKQYSGTKKKWGHQWQCAYMTWHTKTKEQALSKLKFFVVRHLDMLRSLHAHPGFQFL